MKVLTPVWYLEASNIYSLLIALRFRLDEAGAGVTDPWVSLVKCDFPPCDPIRLEQIVSSRTAQAPSY